MYKNRVGIIDRGAPNIGSATEKKFASDSNITFVALDKNQILLLVRMQVSASKLSIRL